MLEMRMFSYSEHLGSHILLKLLMSLHWVQWHHAVFDQMNTGIVSASLNAIQGTESFLLSVFITAYHPTQHHNPPNFEILSWTSCTERKLNSQSFMGISRIGQT